MPETSKHTLDYNQAMLFCPKTKLEYPLYDLMMLMPLTALRCPGCKDSLRGSEIINSEVINSKVVEASPKDSVNSKESDNVNHPSHYNQYEGLEVIDLTEQMNFNRGNAVKYITRAGFKGGPMHEIEDLEKARWYLDREIARLVKRIPEKNPLEPVFEAPEKDGD